MSKRMPARGPSVVTQAPTTSTPVQFEAVRRWYLPDGRMFRLKLGTDGNWRLRLFSKNSEGRFVPEKTPGINIDYMDLYGLRNALVDFLKTSAGDIPSITLLELANHYAGQVNGGTTQDLAYSKIFLAMDLAQQNGDHEEVRNMARRAQDYIQKHRPNNVFGVGSPLLRRQARAPIARNHLLAMTRKICDVEFPSIRARFERYREEEDDEYHTLACRMENLVNTLFPDKAHPWGSASLHSGLRKLANKLRCMSQLDPTAVARAALRALCVMTPKEVDNFLA